MQKADIVQKIGNFEIYGNAKNLSLLVNVAKALASDKAAADNLPFGKVIRIRGIGSVEWVKQDGKAYLVSGANTTLGNVFIAQVA